MARDTEAELDKYINDLADIPSDDTDPNANADVDDAADNGGNADDNEQQEQQTEDNQQTDEQAAQDQGAGQDTGRQEPKNKDNKGKQRGKGKKGADEDQLRPLGDGTFADSKGNIVDQSGKLIAQNGFAARMYHTNKRLKALVEERSQQLNTISQQVGEVRALAQSIQQYGLSNDETAQALDMAGRMKRGDVLGVAKDVLAMIAAQGYNVTDLLGSDVGDSIELKAINRMIDQRLAPITRQEQDRQQQTEAARRGELAYNKFIAENDYADVHANDIVQVMRREGVNPQTAYNRLFQFAVSNGLDFSQPLGPQVTARIEANKQKAQQSRQQKPMPNGAATRHNGAVPAQPLASADDDWGTIISEVQRTIGNA